VYRPDVDPQGDTEIIKAQEMMRATLERWIPTILAAQMPEGYLQTAYILADRATWPERCRPITAAITKATSRDTSSSRPSITTLSPRAKICACITRQETGRLLGSNIGPGKKEWFDGHQEMETGASALGRFVNDQEGNHRGDAYIALAKFLLDSRRGGSEYDQSHLPPGQQYEAVGHAVRAMYFYSGMADIAAETRTANTRAP